MDNRLSYIRSCFFVVVVAFVMSACEISEPEHEYSTYANPINIDYTYSNVNIHQGLSYRSGADPAVVSFRDKYYMFVTRSQGYWMSDDLSEWNFLRPQNWFFPASNAPGAWPMGDSLLIALANPAGWQNVIYTDNPELGTWQGAASLIPLTPVHDPALFVDDHGKAYMNEMLLGRNWKRDREHIQKITDFARELEKVTCEEDPNRYTMIPNQGDFDIYHKAELTDIPMLVGWNLYFGWYENELESLGKFLDHHHEILPDKPTLITEYGAGSDPRIRSLEPLRFDFSIEWQNRFLQSNLRQVMERPFVAGAAVWNLFDFGSESRRDAYPPLTARGS